jgi:hypothetical protein
VFYFLANWGPKFHAQLGEAQPLQHEFIASNRQTLLLDEVLMCQVASSDKATFARFLLVFLLFQQFSEIFSPLKLNLLWDDRHLCHITKKKKKALIIQSYREDVK